MAYGIYRLVSSLDIGQLAWDRSGPYVAGGVIVAAGLYELTPFKRAQPAPLPQSLRTGSAFRSGLAHGRDCVGCSGALMAVLFVLGVMSLFWMAIVTVVIFAEKVLAAGPRLAPAVAVGLSPSASGSPSRRRPFPG